MQQFDLRNSLAFILLAAIPLVGCQPDLSEQAMEVNAATQTVAALDSIAEGTIEAIQGTGATATSGKPPTQPTETQTPPVTVTRTATATLEFVEVEVSVDTNCRSGPNTSFDYIGALLVGERTQIVARTDVANYYIVNNPDRPGRTCWLWDRYATVYGDPSGLPLLDAPPSPTPAPASVAGWAFTDVNDNGKRDSDESDDGISGATIVLRVGTCPGGIVAYSAESNSAGRYIFPVVLAADYCLTADPDGPALKPGQYSISLGSGESSDGLNFWRTP